MAEAMSLAQGSVRDLVLAQQEGLLPREGQTWEEARRKIGRGGGGGPSGLVIQGVTLEAERLVEVRGVNVWDCERVGGGVRWGGL